MSKNVTLYNFGRVQIADVNGDGKFRAKDGDHIRFHGQWSEKDQKKVVDTFEGSRANLRQLTHRAGGNTKTVTLYQFGKTTVVDVNRDKKFRPEDGDQVYSAGRRVDANSREVERSLAGRGIKVSDPNVSALEQLPDLDQAERYGKAVDIAASAAARGDDRGTLLGLAAAKKIAPTLFQPNLVQLFRKSVQRCQQTQTCKTKVQE
ncbi:MAG: hypothetical protein IT572_00675 [Deltaproteobacteria bacterium]|nr:hypothetical protein [Deltaproteobacteria bacterium]